MTDGGIVSALNRTERALERIERVLDGRGRNNGGDELLRAKVREVIAELDEVIRAAG